MFLETYNQKPMDFSSRKQEYVETVGHSIACGYPLAVERLKRLEKKEKQVNFLRPSARERSKNNQLHSR